MEMDEGIGDIVGNLRTTPVDIEFRNLCYNVGKKSILKSIGGKFNAGQLIGILGSSGAGKTTLLNILAGQTQSGVRGTVYVNGRPRTTRQFRKMSCYIRQEDLIQPLLTVLESMTIVADLKLDKRFSREDKKSVISRILSLIGLQASLDTMVEHLSGGQRKRLIIALELVNNPSVIFLDEPTTGLDDVSMKNCMTLLKSLTLHGRTIVCTIHQPSDLLLRLFDTVYFMSDGFCIFNGAVAELVPFLSSGGFSCPTSYNPSDYIIEIVHGQETNTRILKDLSKNGHTDSPLRKSNSCEDCDQSRLPKSDSCAEKIPNGFWTQFSTLFYRNCLQLKRNKISLALHLGHNILCGVLLGLLFYRVGTTADFVIVNLKHMFGLVVYFMFTHGVAPILLYPSEVKLLEREYFNRWYSLKAYFAAFTVILLPVAIVTTLIFVVFVYFLGGQPLEWYRFVEFCVISVLTAMTSQGFGYTIATLFNPVRGTCIGSAMMIVLVLLAIQGVGYGDTLEPYMKVLMQFSYPFQAYAGLALSILHGRGRLQCDDIFCYFDDSDYTLRKMGMGDMRFANVVLALFAFFLLHRITSYALLKIRLSSGCSWFRNIELFNLS